MDKLDGAAAAARVIASGDATMIVFGRSGAPSLTRTAGSGPDG
jgi:hypothetical protein